MLATVSSAGGGSLDLIFITLSPLGLLNWPEETVRLPCRCNIGGSWVLGGNTAELTGDVGMAEGRRVLRFGWGLGLRLLSLGRLFIRVGAEVPNRGDSIGEVCTGAGSAGMPLPFDLGLAGPLGLTPVSPHRRFPRRGDSSATFLTGGLAGVDDATGPNASIGEDWVILSAGTVRFGLVNTILRGDGSLRERVAADALSSEALISGPLTGVRGNADATGSAASATKMACSVDPRGESREGSSTG